MKKKKSQPKKEFIIFVSIFSAIFLAYLLILFNVNIFISILLFFVTSYIYYIFLIKLFIRAKDSKRKGMKNLPFALNTSGHEKTCELLVPELMPESEHDNN